MNWTKRALGALVVVGALAGGCRSNQQKAAQEEAARSDSLSAGDNSMAATPTPSEAVEPSSPNDSAATATPPADDSMAATPSTLPGSETVPSDDTAGSTDNPIAGQEEEGVGGSGKAGKKHDAGMGEVDAGM